MGRAIGGAAVGLVSGIALAVLLLFFGPTIVRWTTGVTDVALEQWVVYLCLLLGGGFGATTGALIGIAAALAASRSASPRQ
jgi:hypothetical protein